MTTTKRRIFRHILSLLLAIVMSLGMMSVTAFAEETPPEAKKNDRGIRGFDQIAC